MGAQYTRCLVFREAVSRSSVIPPPWDAPSIKGTQQMWWAGADLVMYRLTSLSVAWTPTPGLAVMKGGVEEKRK